ncbi:MAG TPA: shikimate kinase [Clostridiales bacterium]|jgi:shikimate kinase|nr:shikimate kinase [Clostridiales bacterium]
MKNNIVLIGMPGSGKTTVGRELSLRTGMPQADGDHIIEDAEGRKLQDILDTEGTDYFKVLEGKVLASLAYQKHVISPGGSAVYYPEAMVHLSNIGDIVYLNVEFPEICRRVTNLESRGIVFKPGQTFEDLYNERTPLYEKYAEVNLDTKGMTAAETAEEILRILGYR